MPYRSPTLTDASGRAREPVVPVPTDRCTLCGGDSEAREPYAAIFAEDGEGAESRVIVVCRRCIDEGYQPTVITEMHPLSTMLAVTALDPELNAEYAEIKKSADARAQLIAFADRIFYRQARDQAEMNTLSEAMRIERQLVEDRYRRLSENLGRQMWWRDQALESIARSLFQDADAKKKSLALTYGTIGRKDFKEAPTLEHADVAREQCQWHLGEAARAAVTIALKQSLPAFEHGLLTLLGKWNQGIWSTPEEAVRNFVEGLADADLTLAWGVLKRMVATDALPLPDGVVLAPARSEYYATVTEG